MLVVTHCRVRWTHLSHHLHDDALEHRAPEEQAHNLDYVLLPQMAVLDEEAHLNTHLLHAQHRHTAVQRHSLHAWHYNICTLCLKPTLTQSEARTGALSTTTNSSLAIVQQD